MTFSATYAGALADHVGDAAAVGAVVERRRRRVGLAGGDEVRVHAEHLGDDDLHRRHDAAAEVVQAGVELEGAVLVHLEAHAAGLGEGAEHAVLVRAGGDADAAPEAAPPGGAGPARGPVEGHGAALEALAHARVAERQAGHEVGVEGLDHVLEAELDRVEPQRGRHPVHVDLGGRGHLRGAPAAGGAPDRRVREHGAALVLVVRHPVELGDLLAHVDGVVRRARRVGAGVQRGRGLEVEQLAVRRAGGADGRGQVAGRTMVAIMHSSRSRRSLTGRRVACARKAQTGSMMYSVLPPNDPPMGTLMTRTRWYSMCEQLRDDGARGVHALARGPDGHAAGAVALGDADVRLERGVVDARRAGGRGDDHGALEVRALALVDLVLVDDVAAGVDGHVRPGPARRRR